MSKILENAAKVARGSVKAVNIVIAICAATVSVIGVVGLSGRRR